MSTTAYLDGLQQQLWESSDSSHGDYPFYSMMSQLPLWPPLPNGSDESASITHLKDGQMLHLIVILFFALHMTPQEGLPENKRRLFGKSDGPIVTIEPEQLKFLDELSSYIQLDLKDDGTRAKSEVERLLADGRLMNKANGSKSELFRAMDELSRLAESPNAKTSPQTLSYAKYNTPSWRLLSRAQEVRKKLEDMEKQSAHGGGFLSSLYELFVG